MKTCCLLILVVSMMLLPVVNLTTPVIAVNDIPKFEIFFTDNTIKNHVLIESIDDSTSRIQLTRSRNDSILSSRFMIVTHDIYQLQIGDVDRDNRIELYLGVIKTCDFDSVSRKRLFAYEIFDGSIQAKWLGTYLGFDLQDFKVVGHNGFDYIYTVEKNENNSYYVGQYNWEGFGPKWITYLGEGLSHEEAKAVFDGL